MLQFVVYAFATSLIFNFAFVYLLTSLGLYGTPSVYALLAIEFGAGAWLLKKSNFVFRFRSDLSEGSREWMKNFDLQDVSGCLLFGLAVATVLAYSYLIYQNFGSVFVDWDDTISWDRWAEQWASGRFPGPAGYYPQLMPANWSITYQMIRNTDVKMFGKAVMPLFPVATMLLFIDLARRWKSREMLFSTTLYGGLLYMFIGVSLVVSGYMETALPFFAWLAMYSLLELSERGPTTSGVLLASLFAGATALVKQGGLYILVFSIVWTGITIFRRHVELNAKGELGRMICAAAAGLLLALPWYSRQYLAISRGAEPANISYLFSLTARGRSYGEIFKDAIHKLYINRRDFSKPFCWFLLVTSLASLADLKARRVLLWALLPVFVLWALFFSYEVRTASLALPYIAYCSGVGAGVLVRPLRPLGARARDLFRTRRRGFITGTVCVFGAFVALYFDKARTALTANWQPEYMADIARLWAVPLAISGGLLCVVGVLAKRARFTVRTGVWIAVGVLIWLGIETTTTPSANVIGTQIDLQKQIGSPSLNKAIYEVAEREGLHGKVATDYWIFDRLPVLKDYYFKQPFPAATTMQTLKAVAAKPGVCYILVPEAALAGDAKKALGEGLFRTIAVDSDYRFIQTCGNVLPGRAK